MTIGDGKVTSSRRPTPGQGVLVGFGDLIGESFHHNVAYVENEGESDVKLVQIDNWTGDSLAFHDKCNAGEPIRPFDVIDATGTNLQMFNNILLLRQEPLDFFWNDMVYTSIEEWQTDTGLDSNSEFFIGPFPTGRAGRTAGRSMSSCRNRRCAHICSTSCTVSPNSAFEARQVFQFPGILSASVLTRATFVSVRSVRMSSGDPDINTRVRRARGASGRRTRGGRRGGENSSLVGFSENPRAC